MATPVDDAHPLGVAYSRPDRSPLAFQERIAAALERIAVAMEQPRGGPQQLRARPPLAPKPRGGK
jgi:hypothetical protein